MATESLHPSVDPEEDAEIIADLPPIAGAPLSLPNIDVRERALPIRPGDLTRLLIAQPDLSAEDRDLLGKLGALLGAIFHTELYARLRDLKELYSPLDPDSDYVRLPHHSRPLTDNSDEEFFPPFEATLDRANYRRLDIGVIQQAIQAPNELGLTYVPDFTLFEHIRVYVRGYTQISGSSGAPRPATASGRCSWTPTSGSSSS